MDRGEAGAAGGSDVEGAKYRSSLRERDQVEDGSHRDVPPEMTTIKGNISLWADVECICPSITSEVSAEARFQHLELPLSLPKDGSKVLTTAGRGSGGDGAGSNRQGSAQCCYDGIMPQVDFAASLSASLGLPAPFGSIGRVDPTWWAMVGGDGSSAECAGEGGSVRPGWGQGQLLSYHKALAANAWQVGIVSLLFPLTYSQYVIYIPMPSVTHAQCNSCPV